MVLLKALVIVWRWLAESGMLMSRKSMIGRETAAGLWPAVGCGFAPPVNVISSDTNRILSKSLAQIRQGIAASPIISIIAIRITG